MTFIAAKIKNNVPSVNSENYLLNQLAVLQALVWCTVLAVSVVLLSHMTHACNLIFGEKVFTDNAVTHIQTLHWKAASSSSTSHIISCFGLEICV